LEDLQDLILVELLWDNFFDVFLNVRPCPNGVKTMLHGKQSIPSIIANLLRAVIYEGREQ